MRIIILGAGTIGMELARSLIADGHSVVIVDSDVNSLREASCRLDCSVVRAGRRSYDVLEDAGIASADALVAVTPSDEINMISCAMAEAVYPDTLKIAMTCDPDYYQNFIRLSRMVASKPDAGHQQLLGIDWMVNPDVEMSALLRRVMVRLRRCSSLDLGGGYSLVTPRLGASSPLVGLEVGRLSEVRGWHFRVVCVYDDEKVVPAQATDLVRTSAGMRLVVLARTDEVDAVASLCGVAEKESLSVLVAGISPIVTLMLGDMCDNCEVKAMQGGWLGRIRPELAVVDASSSKCRQLAEAFEGIKVFCGDVTDAEFVREEGLGHCDVAVSFTDNYDRNLVTSAFLKSHGIPTTAAITANADVVGMATKLGVDVPISMRDAVVDSIKNHLYGRNVLFIEQISGVLDIVCCTFGKRSCLPEDAIPVLVRSRDESEFREVENRSEFAVGDRVVILIPSGRLDKVRKAIG